MLEKVTINYIFEKEKPMDRTEEAKALREFVKERGLGKNWLEKTVKKLRKGKPYEELTENQHRLLYLLCEHGHAFVRARTGVCILPKYEPVYSYIVRDSYTLPALETPPRFKRGTPLVFKPTGKVYIVAERTERKPDDAPEDWCMFERVDGDRRCYTADWNDHQELPPMPDKDALAKQGYELTMEVADCSKNPLPEAFVLTSGRVADASGGRCLEGCFNGWRWLVRKIEKKEEPKVTCTIADALESSKDLLREPNIAMHIPSKKGDGTWAIRFVSNNKL